MGIQGLISIVPLLIILKGSDVFSQQLGPGQFVVPAVIKPLIQPDIVPEPAPVVPSFSSGFQGYPGVSGVPSFPGGFPPIIIDDDDDDDDWHHLLYFLIFAMRNRRGGIGYGGGYGGGYGDGYGSGYGCNRCGGGCGCGSGYGCGGGCGYSGGCSCSGGCGSNSGCGYSCNNGCNNYNNGYNNYNNGFNNGGDWGCGGISFVPYPFAVPVNNPIPFGGYPGPSYDGSGGIIEEVYQPSIQTSNGSPNEINLIIRTDSSGVA